MNNRFADCQNLDELILQVIGAASVTWNTAHGNEVFDDTEAAAIGAECLDILRNGSAYIPKMAPDGPLLGLTTTRELLNELTARIDVDYSSGGGGLDYTAVGGRPEHRTPVAAE